MSAAKVLLLEGWWQSMEHKMERLHVLRYLSAMDGYKTLCGKSLGSPQLMSDVQLIELFGQGSQLRRSLREIAEGRCKRCLTARRRMPYVQRPTERLLREEP